MTIDYGTIEYTTTKAPDLARHIENAQRAAARWRSTYSVEFLRVSLGLVFLGFGVLKFFPGLSPAADLATRTVETLTLGIVPGPAALILTAVMECFVGLTLVSGRLLRTGLAVLGVSLIGIMSPLVLFAADLFPVGPTLEAQYVLKDVVLVTAGMVIAAKALGARLVAPGSPGDESARGRGPVPAIRPRPHRAARRLAVRSLTYAEISGWTDVLSASPADPSR